MNADEFYESFGTDVIKAIHAQLELGSGDIGPLLARLGLPPQPDPDSQHRILRAFIHRNGVPFFLRALKPGITPADFPRLRNELRQTKQKETQYPDGTLRKMINTSDYQGPDRRSGIERRKGLADRRSKTDTLHFRNRRFGGRDRRKTIRREEDRKRAELQMLLHKEQIRQSFWKSGKSE